MNFDHRTPISVMLLLLCLVPLLSSAQDKTNMERFFRSVRKGNEALDQERYEKAAEHFHDALKIRAQPAVVKKLERAKTLADLFQYEERLMEELEGAGEKQETAPLQKELKKREMATARLKHTSQRLAKRDSPKAASSLQQKARSLEKELKKIDRHILRKRYDSFKDGTAQRIKQNEVTDYASGIRISFPNDVNDQRGRSNPLKGELDSVLKNTHRWIQEDPSRVRRTKEEKNRVGVKVLRKHTDSSYQEAVRTRSNRGRKVPPDGMVWATNIGVSKGGFPQASLKDLFLTVIKNPNYGGGMPRTIAALPIDSSKSSSFFFTIGSHGAIVEETTLKKQRRTGMNSLYKELLQHYKKGDLRLTASIDKETQPDPEKLTGKTVDRVLIRTILLHNKRTHRFKMHLKSLTFQQKVQTDSGHFLRYRSLAHWEDPRKDR